MISSQARLKQSKLCHLTATLQTSVSSRGCAKRGASRGRNSEIGGRVSFQSVSFQRRLQRRPLILAENRPGRVSHSASILVKGRCNIRQMVKADCNALPEQPSAVAKLSTSATADRCQEIRAFAMS